MNDHAVALSEAQRGAVEWVGGPLLVLAGPGAGKTEVLAARAARIIRAAPKRRFRVVGLTFTNLAAGEMKERVGLRLGSNSDRARIGTFHSLCAAVLRQHGSHLGLRPDFRILHLASERALILADALGPRAPWGIQPPPAGRITRNLDQLFRRAPESEAEPSEEAGVESGWDGRLLRTYVSQLIQSNCMDYGSLLYCVLDLVRAQPRIASDFPIAYPHVIVDEYQDTSAIQDRILRELWPPGSAEFFVVADDDQMIYQWNGASPERIEALREDYGMTVYSLPETYRCTPEVVGRANRLMAASPSVSPRHTPLVAAARDAGPGVVRVKSCPDSAAEVIWVAADIARRSLAVGDCAVLARTGRLVEAAHEAIREAGIAAWCRKPREEFSSPAIRWILAGLRLANAPRDGAYLRLLVKALRDLGGASLSPAAMEARADLENGALLGALVEDPAAVTDSSPAGGLIGILRRRLVERSDYRGFLRESLDLLQSEETQTGDAADREATHEEFRVWRSLTEQVRKQVGKEASLGRFLHEIDLRPLVAEPAPDEVKCLTIHQAKGKEFRHVYLIGLAEDLLPSHYAKRNGANGPQIEEERRNCFVAITRAYETLTLTCAAAYDGWPKSPSRFLADMGLSGHDDSEIGAEAVGRKQIR